MASQFFHVHHHLKPDMAGKWWQTFGEQMPDQASLEKYHQECLKLGFFNHAFMPVAQNGPIYCIWEAKEGISEAQFQEFIDGPMGPNFGIGAMNNNISKIDLELTGGQAPYERKI